MLITKEEYEIYDKAKSGIDKRTAEIFNLLKGLDLDCREHLECCDIEGDLEFRIGGTFLNEYDYRYESRPLDYLFMTDEEIVKAEEEREESIRKTKELEEKERQRRIREKEIEQLKELKKKYPFM